MPLEFFTIFDGLQVAEVLVRMVVLSKEQQRREVWAAGRGVLAQSSGVPREPEPRPLAT